MFQAKMESKTLISMQRRPHYLIGLIGNIYNLDWLRATLKEDYKSQGFLEISLPKTDAGVVSMMLRTRFNSVAHSSAP